ncbi:MAG: DUF4349 domain-containing protein [Oscillospiraceae bacterium]|nr:DUF4349 domain-containing protein [Oscillospiraceae bacterium]
MKHRIFSLLLALSLGLTLTACSAGRSESSADVSYESGGSSSSYAAEDDSYYTTEEAETAAEVELSSDSESTVYNSSDVKLIRRASLALETLDFEAACQELEALVTSLGGYMESAEVYEGGYYDSYHYAYYTARVPSECYDAFLNQVGSGENCQLTYKSESTEDVGQAYADVESHIEMLNTKLTRLNELLAQAESMTDIITIEEAITETEYELASYTTEKNQYDDLIGYATFSIGLDEVTVYTPVEQSFGSRVQAAFLAGCEGFVDGVQGFALWVVRNCLSLLVVVVIAAVVVLLLARRRKRRRAKLNPPSPTTDEKRD